MMGGGGEEEKVTTQLHNTVQLYSAACHVYLHACAGLKWQLSLAHVITIVVYYCHPHWLNKDFRFALCFVNINASLHYFCEVYL